MTVSAGWARQLLGDPFERQTAPTVGLSYGYRPLKFLELEAGVLGALHPGRQLCNAHACYDPFDRYIWVPFGVRFIAPLASGRVELSAGGGGLYENYATGEFDPFTGSSDGRSGWGGYFAGGAAAALDHRRRYWIGVTPRVILANPRYARDRFFTITGDFSFRF